MNKFFNVKTLLLGLFAALALSSCGVNHRNCAWSCGATSTECISSCQDNKEVACDHHEATEEVVEQHVVAQPLAVATTCVNSCKEKDCLQRCSDYQGECVNSCREKDCIGCKRTSAVAVETVEAVAVQEIVVGTACIDACHDKDCLQRCSDYQGECVKSCRDKNCKSCKKTTPKVRKAAVLHKAQRRSHCSGKCKEVKSCNSTCTDCQTKCSKDSEDCIKE